MKRIIPSIIITEIRGKALMSQKEFANELEIHPNTIYLWEKGKVAPNYKQIRKLKEFCDKKNIEFTFE